METTTYQKLKQLIEAAVETAKIDNTNKPQIDRALKGMLVSAGGALGDGDSMEAYIAAMYATLDNDDVIGAALDDIAAGWDSATFHLVTFQAGKLAASLGD